jgi:hypothetical protein
VLRQDKKVFVTTLQEKSTDLGKLKRGKGDFETNKQEQKQKTKELNKSREPAKSEADSFKLRNMSEQPKRVKS